MANSGLNYADSPRRLAKARGELHYFTNKPCVRGHVCTRFVKSGNCIECAKINLKNSRYGTIKNNKESINKKRRVTNYLKKEAVKSGLSKYNTGEPCSNGHLSDRFVRNERCVQCKNECEVKHYNTPEGREKQSNYAKNNKDKINERIKNYTKKNPNFKLAKLIRSRFMCCVKRDYKKSSVLKLVGCSLDELKLYIESQFQQGMSWDNWSLHGWHLDHIRPLSSFNLIDYEEQKKAFHYTNLQPLWAKDNLSKGAKYNVGTNS